MELHIKIALAFLLLMTLLTFCVYGWDKHLAKSPKKPRRIPEKTLLLLAAFGGSIGALTGMLFFRHKTLHKKFKYGVPAIIFIQILILYRCLR